MFYWKIEKETNLPNATEEDLWFIHDHTKCIEDDEAPAWINFIDDDDDVSPFFRKTI